MPRRTPTLTRQAQAHFERIWRVRGWRPGFNIRAIAASTGLTPRQVRDSIMGESADEWRRAFVAKIQEERNAST